MRTPSSDFFDYGLDGISVTYATNRRDSERARDTAVATPSILTSTRQWLGSLLIATGNGIAGKRCTTSPVSLRSAVGIDLAA